jgi:hypothetical protein
MSIADAFAEAEAIYRAQVIGETWGHLAPRPQKQYTGYLIFACGVYGDIVALQAEFEDLPDSPWFYEDMQEYISRVVMATEGRGFIYRFDGTYTKSDDGDASFDGQTIRCELTVNTKLSNRKPK